VTDLAIIIVAYKTRDVLCACLRSLDTDSSLQASAVVVIDNASGDGTPDMVRSEFPKVTLIVNTVNVGFSVANNQGIRATQSHHVLLLNPDAEVKPGAVAGMAAFLDRHSQVGFVGCQLLNTDGSMQLSWYPLPVPLSRFLEKWSGYPRMARRLLGIRDAQPEIREDGAFRVDVVKGACLMFRRETLDAIGLLDEASFLYADDIDLCMRARRAGWDGCMLPNLRVVHHGWVSTDQEICLTIISSRRSALLLYRKHYPGWMALLWKLFIYSEIFYKWALNGVRVRTRGADPRARERYCAFRTLGREILGLRNRA
jgi:GT2 family glycosyltransferase